MYTNGASASINRNVGLQQREEYPCRPIFEHFTRIQNQYSGPTEQKQSFPIFLTFFKALKPIY